MGFIKPRRKTAERSAAGQRQSDAIQPAPALLYPMQRFAGTVIALLLIQQQTV
jgi:hypothetical protein